MTTAAWSIVPVLAAALLGCAGCKGKTGAPAAPGESAHVEPAAEPAPPPAPAPQQPAQEGGVADVYWSQVAGKFYPGEKDELQAEVEQHLAKAERVAALEARDIVGITSPHAGYVYSGPVAGWGYKQLAGRPIRTVVILGFSHRGAPSLSSLLPYGGYRTPLGVAPVDAALQGALLAAGKGVVQTSKLAFAGEHSLETQIPFVQVALPQASILPVMVAHPGGGVDEKLAQLLFDAIGKRKDVAVVASTDLSHYTPYEEAVQTDGETLEWIAQMKWKEIALAGPDANRMCGHFTVGVLMKLMGLYPPKDRKGTVVRYKNSGDTSGKKEGGVVGYGVVAFSLPDGARTEEAPAAGAPAAGAAQAGKADAAAAVLSTIALDAIRAAAGKTAFAPTPPDGGAHAQKQGAVVVLVVDGRIAGEGLELSMGLPLYAAVAEAARRAVTDDPRYPAPAPGSLDDAQVKVLPVTQVVPLGEGPVGALGDDGLVVESAEGRGVLLPGEAARMGWKEEEALAHACRRAGLELGCWQEHARRKKGITLTLLKGGTP